MFHFEEKKEIVRFYVYDQIAVTNVGRGPLNLCSRTGNYVKASCRQYGEGVCKYKWDCSYCSSDTAKTCFTDIEGFESVNSLDSKKGKRPCLYSFQMAWSLFMHWWRFTSLWLMSLLLYVYIVLNGLLCIGNYLQYLMLYEREEK